MTTTIPAILFADETTRTTLTGRRLRVRRVDENALARDTARAATRETPAIHCAHGGTVAGAYDYPAETEAVLAVALSPTLVVLWAKRINARGATLSGAGGYLFDGRTNEKTKALARQKQIDDALAIAAQHLRDTVTATRAEAERRADGAR